MNASSKQGGVRVELTRSEMEIMDVLWGSEKPLSRADLLAKSEEKTWKDSSVHILLNGLLQKGAIQEAGLVKRSKTYGRVFAPTMTREEYFATTIFSHRHKPQIVGLFEALLRREDITREDLDAISKMVQQKNV
jgi:predicted transcriptional regulator